MAAHAWKRWSRPVSRVLYVLRRDSHSSRPGVAAWLQQPTREQRGPRYRSPIWSCSEWGLPCRTALAPYAVRSYRTLSPLPVPLRAIGGLLSVALAVSSRCPGVTWHSALRSPDFPRCTCVRRDCPADSIDEFTGTGNGGTGNASRLAQICGVGLRRGWAGEVHPSAAEASTARTLFPFPVPRFIPRSPFPVPRSPLHTAPSAAPR